MVVYHVMTKSNQIQIFNDRKIRTVWDSETEEWYFSVVDVVGILAESETPRRYLSDLKRKLKKEGSEVYDKIVQLKLQAADGKMRLTDVATPEQMFRIIQSIPSPKAEPFISRIKNARQEATILNMQPRQVMIFMAIFTPMSSVCQYKNSANTLATSA